MLYVSKFLQLPLLASAFLLTIATLHGCDDNGVKPPGPNGTSPTATLGVGLQAFTWDDLSDRAKLFENLKGRVSEFSSSGFSHVWMPPPSQSVDKQGYMPQEWYNIIGSDALKSLNTDLSSLGVTPVCDVVINHRTAPQKAACNDEYIVFKNPDWSATAVVSGDDKCDSGVYCGGGSCQCGNLDTGTNFCSAPDIDHTNSNVQSDIIAFLKWLQQEYKFAGWRFDTAKGFSGSFIKQYVTSTGGNFAVGEFWDTNVDSVQQWVASSGIHAFDFPQRFALKAAINKGDFSQLKWGQNPLGLAGVDSAGACTFLDNHDTARPSGQGAGDGGFGSEYAQMLGYVYILTHPAFPWVFIPHYQGGNNDAIKRLISIRGAVGVSPADLPWIARADHDVYAAYIGTSKECSGKLAMKVGPSDWSPCGSGWSLAASGEDYLVWTGPGISEEAAVV